MTDTYDEINKAEYIKQITGILKDIWPDITIFGNIPKIPESTPPNLESAYVARKLAFEDIRDSRKNVISIKDSWQHYWFKCCISDKCDFMFISLKSKGIDREEDLKKICRPDSDLFQKLEDNETKQPYINLCINYLLKRYNIRDSRNIWKKSSKKNKIIFIQLLLPRLIASILVGSIIIATSSEILEFPYHKQSTSLLLYSLILLFISYGYFLFECLKITQKTIDQQEAKKRAISVLKIGTIYSLIFSILFSGIGLFQVYNISETIPETFYSSIFFKAGYWLCRVIFYAAFALFIGIIIQLLWEEKTVSEPF